MPVPSQEAPQDPDVVFSPEYWGDTNDVFTHESFVWIPRAEKLSARALITQLALKAIDGSLQGTQVVPGVVFDTTDDQIAATSPHNYPGTLLLYDAESLRPLDPGSAKYLEERAEEKDDADRDGLTMSPRSLMRSRMETSEHGTVFYGGVRITYSDGNTIYARKSNIAYIAQARKGARQTLEILMGSYNPLGIAENNASAINRVSLIRAMSLHSGVIGETQVSYGVDGKEFKYAYRIRSLEILAGGQPATAPQSRPVFSLRPSTTH